MREGPVLAFPIGDPGGVGPEIAVRLAADEEAARSARVILIGDRWIIEESATRNMVSLASLEIEHVGALPAGAPIERGPKASQGAASFMYLARATELAVSGAVAGVTTGPISKAAWHLAGHRYPGQTEALAHQVGASDVAMMLVGGGLRSVLITTHLSLADMLGRLSIDAVAKTIRLTEASLPAFIGHRPRIAIAAVNPHAGENRAFGTEDDDILTPAVDRCRRDGIDVAGPIPGDSVFSRALRGEFDVVISAYHDQGLIPVKLAAEGRAVNVTLGLPFVRTSPDHGTAFDIAGTGAARLDSAREAVLLAAAMAAAHAMVGKPSHGT